MQCETGRSKDVPTWEWLQHTINQVKWYLQHKTFKDQWGSSINCEQIQRAGCRDAKFNQIWGEVDRKKCRLINLSLVNQTWWAEKLTDH